MMLLLTVVCKDQKESVFTLKESQSSTSTGQPRLQSYSKHMKRKVHLSVVSLEVLADFMLTEDLSQTEINQWPPSTGREASYLYRKASEEKVCTLAN